MAVGAQFSRAAVRLHRAHWALHGHVAAGGGVAAGDPGLAQLHVDDVAFFQVDDLVGHAGQRHRVAGQKVLAARLRANAQDQRRALPRTHHTQRLVAAEHRYRVSPAQTRQRALHGLQQVAVVQAVHQVRDDLGVGLAVEGVAALLQLGTQLVVVLDDAVVDEGDLARGRRCRTRASAEVRVRVVHRRRAVGGPAGVGNAGAGGDVVGRHTGFQLGHARGAASAFQLTALVYSHAAAVVAAVLQPLQAFDEDGDDVARGDRADDAAHGSCLVFWLEWADARRGCMVISFVPRHICDASHRADLAMADRCFG